MMGGGGQGASGTGTGSIANVYSPRGQPTADDMYMRMIQPLFNTALSGANAVSEGYGSPAANAFTQATEQVDRGLTNSTYAPQAIESAGNANNYSIAQLFPQAQQGSQALHGAAMGGLPYASAALNQGFDPAFQQIADYAATDPYRSQALGGAQDAATMGAQGASGMQNMAQQIGGTINPLIQAGFDPQSALFNRSQAQLMDQTNAINAMSGLAGTPYGASTMAKAMGDFGIDWQNKQLGRQVQAAGAAGQAGGQAGNLYGAAPGLARTSAGLPSSTYQGQLGNTLTALGARNLAGTQGAQGYGSLMGSTGAGVGLGQTLGTQGAQSLAQFGAAPYNTAAGIANNALSGLNQQTSLGNNAFDQANKQLANLMQYMGQGQNASQLSGQLGQQGFNQTSSGIGGLFSGLGTLGSLFAAPAGGTSAAAGIGSTLGSAATSA